jgi:DNA-binding NtrC family response regulator
VIAASNRNVEEEVEAGRFRKDLFYRLNAVSISLPPLRERREDILLLAKSFAERVYSLSPKVTFSLEALRLLEKYPWPGNIRELENAVVRAAAICDGTIRLKDLPERVQQFCKVQEKTASRSESESTVPIVDQWCLLSTVEGRHVEKVLKHTKGNKQAAARILGVDRKTLDRMITRHNIALVNNARFPSRAA